MHVHVHVHNKKHTQEEIPATNNERAVSDLVLVWEMCVLYRFIICVYDGSFDPVICLKLRLLKYRPLISDICFIVLVQQTADMYVTTTLNRFITQSIYAHLYLRWIF